MRLQPPCHEVLSRQRGADHSCDVHSVKGLTFDADISSESMEVVQRGKDALKKALEASGALACSSGQNRERIVSEFCMSE